jgi:hypothetical protein
LASSNWTVSVRKALDGDTVFIMSARWCGEAQEAEMRDSTCVKASKQRHNTTCFLVGLRSCGFSQRTGETNTVFRAGIWNVNEIQSMRQSILISRKFLCHSQMSFKGLWNSCVSRIDGISQGHAMIGRTDYNSMIDFFIDKTRSEDVATKELSWDRIKTMKLLPCSFRWRDWHSLKIQILKLQKVTFECSANNLNPCW